MRCHFIIKRIDENKDMLSKTYAHVEQNKRQMIRGINKKGFPIYKNKGTRPMKVLRLLFELNLFREINMYEYDILKICEFNNKLNDYTDLSYDECLCTKGENNINFPYKDSKTILKIPKLY